MACSSGTCQYHASLYVCFVLYNELLAYYPISEIAIYNALIPVLGMFFAAVLLNEKLKWQYFASVLLVVNRVQNHQYKRKTEEIAY